MTVAAFGKLKTAQRGFGQGMHASMASCELTQRSIEEMQSVGARKSSFVRLLSSRALHRQQWKLLYATYHLKSLPTQQGQPCLECENGNLGRWWLTSNHSAVLSLSGQSVARTSSSKTSAAVPAKKRLPMLLKFVPFPRLRS